MQVTRVIARTVLEAVEHDLEKLPESEFNFEEKIKTCLMSTIERLGLKNGQVLWPLRVALSGEPFSPGAFEMATLLGKERTMDRLQQTLNRLL